MLIGLSGFAQSGKNTVADILGEEFRQVSFAKPMRDIIYTLNCFVDGSSPGGPTVAEVVDELNWDVAKVKYPEIRRQLQVLGTQIGREMFGEDFWVDMALKGIKHGTMDKIVVTDVRFPNEAQAIKDLGGVVWRVTRPGIGAVNAHISEHSLDDWKFDYYLVNDGSLEELKMKTAATMHRVTTYMQDTGRKGW